MSANTADANHAVLLHSGEIILIHCKETTYKFSDNESPEFRGTKSGHTYLTSHRIVFRNRSEADLLSSLSMPFVTMRNVSLRGRSISGEVQPQPNGNFTDEVKFSLTFKAGGATEFFRALRTVSRFAIEDAPGNEIPAYKPSRAWYEAAASAYQRPEDFFDWIPKHEAFTIPRPNSVYITDDPPPYPGIRKCQCRFGCESLTKASSRSVHTLKDPEKQVHDGCSFSPRDGLFPNKDFPSAGDGDDANYTTLQHKFILK